jgi:flagellin
MSTTSGVGASADAYTVTGSALTDTTTAWGASDIKINNVSIYKDTIATTSFEGKLNAINNFSPETGVIASAFAELSVDITDATFEALVAATDNGVLSINGATITISSAFTQATFVTALNGMTDETGLTAVASGDTITLTGSNVVAINISGTTATANTSFAAATTYAAIRLDSVDDSPISIELGDGETTAEHGFLEANVGAADFQVNAATLGVASGTSLTGLNIGTASAAASALTTIDSAISTVSDMRSKMGALQNRLNSTVDNLSNVVANTEASRSRIQDTDYAVETTSLAKAQIIQQAATAMLAQANQQPQSVLSLLQ